MNDTELFKAALNKAMKLCSAREFCANDIRGKTESWGIGKEGTEKIIDLLKKEKFIDERRYAAAYAKDKFNYNKWGKLKISAGLKMKGIPVDIIKDSLEMIDNEKYRELLGKLISSHRKKIKAKNQYDLKAKLMRYGISKGFESWMLYELLGEE